MTCGHSEKDAKDADGNCVMCQLIARSDEIIASVEHDPCGDHVDRPLNIHETIARFKRDFARKHQAPLTVHPELGSTGDVHTAVVPRPGEDRGN